VLSKGVEEELQARDGSQFINTRVQTLEHDEESRGRITDIVLSSGEKLDTHDGRIVLCTGPWIPEILTRSNVALPRHSKVPTATGLFAFMVQLNEEQAMFFKGKPVLSHIGRGEVKLYD
jgi:glycerol-3-phosphate dehydrogenase